MHLIHDLRLVLLSIVACLEASRDSQQEFAAPETVQALRLLEAGLDIADEVLVSTCLRPPAPYVDVNAVLADLDPAIATILGPEVTVHMKLGAVDGRVLAQRVDIERILLNLVFNAAAAMSAGGVLTIETESHGDIGQFPTASSHSFGTLQLRVRDTGRGMSDAELEHVVDPMAHPRSDGTGLGLACIALIVTRLAGTLAIDCTHPPGTVVTITLPLASNGMGRVH